MRSFDKLGLEHRVEVGLRPEFATVVIVLLQLHQTVTTRRDRRRILKRKRRFEIGFDHIFRRRQDIGDEVVAELDLAV
ncbi:MAG: hypothetical protein WAV72_26405 [Bradyrhizobium sp.]